ncbi:MAG: alpha-L-fucosidase, partial [Acetatifactor sp.]|nr:alpha-L-fucosidase [Acetatifactor sp.]
GGWMALKGCDTSWAWFWEPVKLNKMARSYNPKLLINPRSGWEGDFYCDEGSHEITGKIIPVPWEKNMCVCSGSSWGWMAEDPVSDFDWLIRMMVNVVCRGGNWLVNIGPDRNGRISDEIRQRMRQVGDWLRTYGESIYATAAGPFEPVDNVYGSTFHGNKVYLHILDREAFRTQKLPLTENRVESAVLFDGGEVEVLSEQDGIRLVLPESAYTADSAGQPDTVLVLTMNAPVETGGDAEIYFTGKE